MNETNKRYYRYDDIHALVRSIAQQIIESGIQIDVVIAIATGGWIPARILRTFLPHDGRYPKPLYSLGIINYDADDTLLDEPRIVQDLPATLHLAGKHILLVDEVADSGKTFAYAYEYCQKMGARTLSTCALHVKSGSIFQPDFIGTSAGTDWIVYPWDNKEKE
jgi:hypothetical protein